MSRESIPKVLFWASIVCMSLMSSSILLIPSANRSELAGRQWQIVLCGFLLWIPLIAGYVSFFFVNRFRRKRRSGRRPPEGVKAWGIMKIFSNFWALVVDIGFLIGLIGFLLFVFINQENYGTYIFLFIAVLTLQLHGMFNGVNYKFISNINKKKATNRKQEDYQYDTL